MLKKFSIFICAIAMLGMASCTTTLSSSKTKDFGSSAITATFADLVVSPRKITYTYKPTNEVRRGGEANVINTAVRMALDANGGGDVLVELQTTVKKKGRKKGCMLLSDLLRSPGAVRNVAGGGSIPGKGIFRQQQSESGTLGNNG